MPPEERPPSEGTLAVEFVIDHPAGCPVVGAGLAVTEVATRIVEGVCRSDVVVDGPEGAAVRREDALVGPACVCPVFDEFGVVPRIVGTTETGVVVRTYVADRETLSALVVALKTVADAVSLRRISTTASAPASTVRVSLDALTPVQRETIEAAVEAGYYADPRGTTLGDLAASHGVSKSAMSRRLQAAERKLVDEVFPGGPPRP